MFKFLTKITADDYNMLINDTPASRKKVVLFANALFIPVLLWFFTAFTMATQLFEASFWGSLFAGLLAALLIFIIDRSIIIANGNGWITTFRIILGLCIATIGSIMIDDCVFHDDINQQLEANKAVKIQSAKNKIQANYQINLAEANAEVNSKYSNWQNAIEGVKAEADGKGGTGFRGAGKITALKLGLSSKQETAYIHATNSRDSILAEQKIAQIKAEDQINSTQGKAMLLHRIEALFTLVFSNKIVGALYLIFTIFIWCLEFIVIMFKMNSSETNYEKKIRMIEEMGANRIDKIANKDKEWFEGGKGHKTTTGIRQQLGNNPPAFYN
ncbi:MAG: DUF4407 domain-containing protein [Bacteroidia bacterium]